MFISVILFVAFGLSPAQLQSTTIMAIVPSSEKNHSVVFQVCAGDTIMRAPEVKLSSDIEEKNVRLRQEIKPNSCLPSAAFIKATDSNTIKIEKVDKKNINIMITDVDKDIVKIQTKIADKSSQILELVTEIQKNNSTNPTLNKKVNNLNSEISDLRKDLQEKRLERERLFALLKG